MLSRTLVAGFRAGMRPTLLRQATGRCTDSVNISSLCCKRREASQLAANLAAHALEVPACFSLSTLLYSPLGTAMLVLLAYNMAVVGTKNMTYVMEITGKDYVQDQQLHQIVRYGVFCCLLLTMEVLFVEV